MLQSISTCLLFACLTCLMGPPLAAQNDWQEGHVVTMQGDTLRGLVRDRDTGPFGGMFGKVQVKEGGKGRARKFAPRKVRSYQWGDAQFVTLYTESESEFFKTRTYVTEGRGEPGFYRVIAAGELTLYHDEFTDEDNFRIDFVPVFKREGNPQLVRATQGILGLKKKLLSEFFADRPALVAQIKNGQLTTPLEVWEAYEKGTAQ